MPFDASRGAEQKCPGDRADRVDRYRVVSVDVKVSGIALKPCHFALTSDDRDIRDPWIALCHSHSHPRIESSGMPLDAARRAVQKCPGDRPGRVHRCTAGGCMRVRCRRNRGSRSNRSVDAHKKSTVHSGPTVERGRGGSVSARPGIPPDYPYSNFFKKIFNFVFVP
jgi:hypothetical protein